MTVFVGTDTARTRRSLEVGGKSYAYYSIAAAEAAGLGDFSRLPAALKVVLENMLRFEDGRTVTQDDIRAFSDWAAKGGRNPREIAYRPARVLMQDFTGVPAVVDLAAMRDAMVALGGDPQKINPLNPVDLVIDHSVMVDEFGNPRAFQMNVEREYQRNGERYEFLKWGQGAFANFRVVPPGTGICHQVNLEYLGQTVWTDKDPSGATVAYPDTLVGTDSHTTMVNGLAILGWGVGGIEAEAAMLGQPISMLIPEVVGFKLTGALREGVTATDLVLTVTADAAQEGRRQQVRRVLRHRARQPAAGRPGDDRQHGARVRRDLRLLPDRRRDAALPARVRARRGAHRAGRGLCQGERLLARRRLRPGLHRHARARHGHGRAVARRAEAAAGPGGAEGRGARVRRGRQAAPRQRRRTRSEVRWDGEGGAPEPRDVPGHHEGQNGKDRWVKVEGEDFRIHDGSVVIAAITSCTNTSNPYVMIGAGLVARKARAQGLNRKPWVKTSLAPGSQVVSDYLEASGLTEDLDALGFNLVGYGCTTCIGNSGPLPETISKAIADADLVACSVLSGNRNFEGRVNPDCRANYLASPPLVVAYALAGDMNIDITTRAARHRADRQAGLPQGHLAEPARDRRARRADGDARSRSGASTPTSSRATTSGARSRSSESETYSWPPTSTYVQNPPYFQGMGTEPGVIHDIEGARILAILGDSVTTDHISPAGSFRAAHPAGAYLQERQVPVS